MKPTLIDFALRLSFRDVSSKKDIKKCLYPYNTIRPRRIYRQSVFQVHQALH